MQEVFLIGTGQTPVQKDAGISEQQLGAQAVAAALIHAQLDPQDVGMVLVGNMLAARLSQQQQLGAHIADAVGLCGVEAATVEAGCGSGAAAARWGYMAVAGGFHDAVVVVGVERMKHRPIEDITAALAAAADYSLEARHGETFISLNARLTAEYMDTHNVQPTDFAHFPITAHRNALTNANALLHKPIDVAAYLESRMLVSPIRLFDAPPVCDGAAAVVLANRAVARVAQRAGLPIVRVRASTIATDSLGLARRRQLLELDGVAKSTSAAFAQAGITHSDVDFFELHDAYPIITTLSLEAAGFAKAGQGVFLGQQGEIALDGELPIATMGGLKARGHPVGATGVYQLAESVQQLSGAAGTNQVPDASLGLVQNIGGTGATVVTHVLERVA